MSNWYVRVSGGTGAGTSWTAAWTIAQLQSNMASLAPGDTVWFAGGNYGAALLEITKSGTSGNPIRFMRVISSDTVPVAAAGWSPAFDSQVVFNTPSGSSALIISASWVTVDGRTGLMGTAGGWVMNFSNASSAVWNNAPATNVTLRYLTCWGPGIITQTGDTRGFDLTSPNPKSFWLMQYCEVGHGGDTSVYWAVAGGVVTDCIMEYCWIHDAGAINASTYHPNICILGESNRMTFRYNRFYNIDVEGLFPAYPSSNLYIYGNVFYQGSIPLNSGRAFENDSGYPASNIFFYNNTIVDLPTGTRLDQATSFTGCISRNNLYWNCANTGYTAGWTHDHNFFSGPGEGGTGDIGSGANPFVNYIANSISADYHITSLIAANRPRDKGFLIAPVSGQTLNIDPDGNIRGADGAWDMGAYEYNAGGGGGGGGGTFWPIKQI